MILLREEQQTVSPLVVPLRHETTGIPPRPGTTVESPGDCPRPLPRLHESKTAEEAVETLRSWLLGVGGTQLLDRAHHSVQGREHVRYRFLLRPDWQPDQWHVVEQTGLCRVKGRITRLDVCTGFFPVDVAEWRPRQSSQPPLVARRPAAGRPLDDRPTRVRSARRSRRAAPLIQRGVPTATHPQSQ